MNEPDNLLRRKHKKYGSVFLIINIELFRLFWRSVILNKWD